MNKLSFNFLLICFLSFILLACGKAQDKENINVEISSDNTISSIKKITLEPKEKTNRWYFTEQAERGKLVFSNNCAVCHGKNAEATANWKAPNASGHYPPPPLNGSAHAWHHPISVLGRVIYNGGAAVGGQMPAFKNTLSESDIIDVIAHFQTYWPDKTYDGWLSIEKSSRE